MNMNVQSTYRVQEVQRNSASRYIWGMPDFVRIPLPDPNFNHDRMHVILFIPTHKNRKQQILL